MPTISMPTKRLQTRPTKICARCGPTTRKLVRHHVEIQRCMLDYVPEWKKVYGKYCPADCIAVCNYCHRIIHGFECDGLYDDAMSEWAHASYYGYRSEQIARDVASACSTAFWTWMEDGSYAKSTSQLRWSTDSARFDGPLVKISSSTANFALR